MIKKIKPIWLKKYISEKEWREDYINLESYYNLGKNEDRKRDKIKIGFLTANLDGRIPFDCEPLTDEESLDLDEQRRRLRHHPFVTAELIIKPKVERQRSNAKLIN